MHHQQLYYANNEELLAEQGKGLEILYDFNQTRPSEGEKRTKLLKQLFAAYGDGSYIEPPLHANWGTHIHFGHDVYANYNLTMVDDTHIYVGNHVMFGPNVIVDTGTHPIQPDIRKKQAQYNASVTIGDNVWVGAGAIILPGVTIGENSVIGAGSIVNKDIPANVIAVGNPCKVLRSIDERDYETYFRGLPIDID